MKRPLMFAAACALISSTAAMPALAGETQEPVTMSVKYKDLNLGSPEGQKQLELRLQRAAKRVCGYDSPITGSRIVSRERKACFDKALNGAMQSYAMLIENHQLGG